MTDPATRPDLSLPDEELDDLREHFVEGSGAYTDSALAGRLVREIDRLRAAPAAEPVPLTLPPTISDDRLGDILADIFGPLPKVDDAGWEKLADGFRFLLFGDGYLITRLGAEPVPLTLDAETLWQSTGSRRDEKGEPVIRLVDLAALARPEPSVQEDRGWGTTRPAKERPL